MLVVFIWAAPYQWARILTGQFPPKWASGGESRCPRVDCSPPEIRVSRHAGVQTGLRPPCDHLGRRSRDGSTPGWRFIPRALVSYEAVHTGVSTACRTLAGGTGQCLLSVLGWMADARASPNGKWGNGRVIRSASCGSTFQGTVQSPRFRRGKPLRLKHGAASAFLGTWQPLRLKARCSLFGYKAPGKGGHGQASCAQALVGPTLVFFPTELGNEQGPESHMPRWEGNNRTARASW